MSNYPAKFLPFYLVVALIFLFIPGFCAQIELTELQKQAIVYRQQGWQLQEQGNIEEALSYYQKATLLDPGYAMAYNDVGIIFEALGYPEQARKMYLKAIEIDPDFPNSYSNLALLYEEEKDYSNAVLFWIKRATFGGSWDGWAQMARKRLEDIARIYPSAFRDITGEYKENLQQLNINISLQVKKPLQQQRQQALQQTLEEVEKRKAEQVFREEQPEEFEVAKGKEPSEISLFREQTTTYSQTPDNKTRALHYLALAKQNFARGEYVAALKEATVAEYFDSSNAEISAFVETIRKKLLK